MDKTVRLRQFCSDHGIDCAASAPLGEQCTFRIGGAADAFISPASEAEIAEVMRMAGEDDVPLLVLGNGSNVLFADEGYRGAVIHLGSRFATMELVDDVTIRCDSGALLKDLCVFAWQNGLTGLEFAYGIPGSVGGAIYMNAGAYGGEIADALESSRHICPREGVGCLDGNALDMRYRHSAYSGGNRIVTGGIFRLQKGDGDTIRAKMDDVMGRRRDKQPLEYPSAGSTFKRPVGAYASALIDECGLRGKRVGGAMVSEKHAGFVINYDRATCRDVRVLIAAVQEEVKSKTGFDLACEVKMIAADK